LTDADLPVDPEWGSLVIKCDGPTCEQVTVMELGAPGPEDWIDVSVWRGDRAEGLGYFCSEDCLKQWAAVRGR
jgi:hypothetical protein